MKLPSLVVKYVFQEVTAFVLLTRNTEAHDYKNTITNALFMHTSAAMYLRHRDKSAYLDNAVKVMCGLSGAPPGAYILTDLEMAYSCSPTALNRCS